MFDRISIQCHKDFWKKNNLAYSEMLKNIKLEKQTFLYYDNNFCKHQIEDKYRNLHTSVISAIIQKPFIHNILQNYLESL